MKTKKFLSLLLAFTMVVSMFTTLTVTASAGSANYTVDFTYNGVTKKVAGASKNYNLSTVFTALGIEEEIEDVKIYDIENNLFEGNIVKNSNNEKLFDIVKSSENWLLNSYQKFDEVFNLIAITNNNFYSIVVSDPSAMGSLIFSGSENGSFVVKIEPENEEACPISSGYGIYDNYKFLVETTPNDGYEVDSVKFGEADATKVSENNYSYTFVNGPSSNVNLVVTFKTESHSSQSNNEVYLDLTNNSKSLDQNYNLTFEEGGKADVTKVKLTWEITDINATRTDNKVWDTENLCWKTKPSSTTINKKGSAKFTLENYSSTKVNATASFKAEGNFKGTASYDVTNGKVTLDTANGSTTYSKTNVPTKVINATITTDDDDFKTLDATTKATKYGTYTVTLSPATSTYYNITTVTDEGITEDENNPMTIAAGGIAVLKFVYDDEFEAGVTATVTGAESEYVDDNSKHTITVTVTNPTDNVTISISPKCFAEGTKITMADSSLKNIEDITIGEKVLTFNHETGKYEAQAVYLAYAGEGKDCGTELTFSDRTKLTIVGEHDLFEQESMKYITLTRTNAKTNIGKHYYNAETGKFVELTSVKTTAPVNYYSLYTEYNVNCIANGMLSVPDDTDYMLNIYEFDGDLTANMTELQKDIATYGIYEYRTDTPYSKAEYDRMNMKYINIVIGKGLATIEKLIGVGEDYLELR